MANLNSNGEAFANSTVNIDSNSISVAIGNTLVTYVGLVNQVYVGDKTQFILGIQTEINIGPVDKVIMGTTTSVLYGSSYIWSKQDTAIHDSASRWAALNNTYHGGVSTVSYAAKYSEDNLGKISIAGILAGYAAMLGLAIIGMEYPPFNQSSGSKEIDKRNAAITLIIDSLGIIIIVIGKYLLAKKLKLWQSFNPVTNLGLASNGLTSWVYSNPDMPQASPFAAFFMQPDIIPTGTVTTPLIPNQAASPVINLATANSLNNSYISMDPKSIILQSSQTLTNSSKMALVDNGVYITDSSPTPNSIIVDNNITSINRITGTVLVNVGPPAANSSLMLNESQAALVKGANGVIVDTTSVAVGTATSYLKFDPSSVTLGGVNLVLKSACVNIGDGSITVLGSPAPPSPVTIAAQGISKNITTLVTPKLTTYLASIEEKITALKMKIKVLQAQNKALAISKQTATVEEEAIDASIN